MKLHSPLRIAVENPQIRPSLLWSFVARLPLGMVFEALLFGVQNATGSLELAGVVTAVAAVGTAVGAPVQGRLLDRFDKKRVISWFTAVQVLTLLVLCAVTAGGEFSGAVLVVLAALVGFSIPSLSAMTRLVLKKVTPRDDLNAAFSLDATTLEIIFIICPTIAVWGTVTFGPVVVFASSAVLVLVGTVFFLASAREDWLTTTEAESETGEKHQRARIQPGRAVAWFVPSIVLSAIPLGLVEAGLIQLTVEQGHSHTRRS